MKRHFLVAIEDTRTGELAIYRHEIEAQYAYDEEGKFREFWWSEGNASCDCNRGIFFDAALGRGKEEDYPCGSRRYRVVSILDRDTGAEVYTEAKR